MDVGEGDSSHKQSEETRRYLKGFLHNARGGQRIYMGFC